MSNQILGQAAQSRVAHAPSRTVSFSVPHGEPISVLWGHPWQFQSPAYWVARTLEAREDWDGSRRPHRLAESLEWEVVACLLGGHGITYEMNLAALELLQKRVELGDSTSWDAGFLEDLLRRPLVIGSMPRRYRFPRQRAQRIAAALERLATEDPPKEYAAAREWLLTFWGIGPKTASWVVRNQFDDAEVAIIDIHVQRAAVNAGVFRAEWTVARDYTIMESVFLQWAHEGGVRAGDLDAVIWKEQALDSRRHREKPSN